MYIMSLLKNLYNKYQSNSFVKEVAYMYFVFRDMPCDIRVEKLSERNQRWVKRYLFKFIRKVEQDQYANIILKKITYKKIKFVLELCRRVENGDKYYLKIKRCIENGALSAMRNKRKIIVVFMANYSATWTGDRLYNLFEQSERYEPYVFVLPNFNGQSIKMLQQEYEKHIRFFKEKNLRVVELYNLKKGNMMKWKDIGIYPDICIWLTSWLNMFPKRYRIEHYAVDTLHTYIPYGFMVAENINRNYVYHQYDHRIHNMAWKNFEESVISVSMAQKYSFVKGTNAVFTGYPKMDMFYLKLESDVWKSLEERVDNYNAKRIIYAPHHTVDEEDPVHFSTFAYNYKDILGLAQKYDKETVWVFKPHPHLKYKAIKYGIFKDEEEWEQYENAWSNLKNATVVNDGMYYDLLVCSDGMILDSVSFLAEYLYAHKPLLFLEGKGQRFNDFGEKLMKVHYTAEGNQISGIEDFILDVVVGQNDSKKDMREQFFVDNLDYVSRLGSGAADNIFTVIDCEIHKQ